MIGYMDRSFCRRSNCKFFGNGCDHALTEEVIKQAHAWWGSEEAPISISYHTKCFEEKECDDSPPPASSEDSSSEE